MLKLFPIKTSIYKTSSYDECIEFYKKNEYKKIFINFDDNEGKKIAEEITGLNPNQRILLLNNNFDCINSNNCDNCVKNFNRTMMIKPINQEQLSKVICDKFKCEGINKDNYSFTMEKINKLIYKKFPYFTYKFNNDYTTFTSEQMTPQILLFVTDRLQENGIKFKVLDYENINIIRT